ncbi:CBS domain-containing protein [Actinoallomurus sp. NBC_01490]|uniref:CBS domain-containing protein n=1 Tax=Actinoallomurus sp. NBC_01490 TaxID=2903557 RepID=UPI002E329523|nr:CBS domain-containing protein [Actinoallomurus sp. NBC_01490]
MTRSVVSAYPDAPFQEIVHVMIERGITALPVVDEDHHVMGFVSESDLLAKEAFEPKPRRRLLRRSRNRQPATAADVMTAPAVSVRPETTVVQAAQLLDRRRIKRLPVVDDENRLVGIVSRRDLLHVFARTDQEIREEIIQQIFARLLLTDPAQVSVRVRDGVVTLSGTLPHENLISIAVRLTAAVDGVVSVIDEMGHAEEQRASATRPPSGER